MHNKTPREPAITFQAKPKTINQSVTYNSDHVTKIQLRHNYKTAGVDGARARAVTGPGSA